MIRCGRRTGLAPHRPRCRNHARLLLVIGDLDAVTAPRLARRLANHRSIRVFDLSGVTFIDAAGLWAIVEATRVRSEPRHSCAVSLRPPAVQDRRLDNITGVAAAERTALPRRLSGGWQPRSTCVSTDFPPGSATTRRPHTPRVCTEDGSLMGKKKIEQGLRDAGLREACTADGQGRRQGPSR